MAVENIIILAKTYPELSSKYGPLVCVAGVNEYGEWRRLYPIPFEIWVRDEFKELRFRKWDVIRVYVEKAEHDPRKESFRVVDWKKIKVVGRIENWGLRLHVIQQLLDPNLEVLVESGRSLGVIKPRRVEKFFAKPRNRLRSEAEKLVLDKMEAADSKVTLLEYYELGDAHLLPEVKEPEITVEELPWIGYKFYCANPNCRGHETMVIDWEAQELFRKYKAVEGPVRKKLFYEMTTKRDLYFIMGNTWRYYKSFMIIGLFYPPKDAKPIQPVAPLFKKKPTLENYF